MFAFVLSPFLKYYHPISKKIAAKEKMQKGKRKE